jgi:hypothetical protein
MNFLSKLSQLSGKMRIAIILSVLWLIYVGLCPATYTNSLGGRHYGHGKFHPGDFIFFGVLPLVIIWWRWWIKEEFRKESEKENDIDK